MLNRRMRSEGPLYSQLSYPPTRRPLVRPRPFRSPGLERHWASHKGMFTKCKCGHPWPCHAHQWLPIALRTTTKKATLNPTSPPPPNHAAASSPVYPKAVTCFLLPQGLCMCCSLHLQHSSPSLHPVDINSPSLPSHKAKAHIQTPAATGPFLSTSTPAT